MKKLLLLTTFLAIAILISAQIIHVPADFASIQEGIDAAGTADTVLVDSGTYFENINFKGKAITLASHYILEEDTNYINNTIIDGSQAANPDEASVITLNSGEDTSTIINGFTITGGTGTYDTSIVHLQFGGGIYCRDAGATIEHNKIIYNTCESDSAAGGVGIQAFSLSGGDHWVIIRNNTISHNTAIARGLSAFGGGISCLVNSEIYDNIIEYNRCENMLGIQADGGGIEIEQYIDTIEATISGNTIRYNTLVTDYVNVGAGICLLKGQATITNNIISSNEAHSNQFANGGAIYVFENTGMVNIINNEIVENSCYSEDWARGGAIGLWLPGSNVNIGNNTFQGNQVLGDENRGGAIWALMPEKPLTIQGNLFWNNTGPIEDISSGAGGAICVMDAEDEVIIDKNIFTGNEMYNGGGLYFRHSVLTTVSNNIFDGNASLFGGAINYYYPSIKNEDEIVRPMLVNNTIINNTAESTGGGIRMQSVEITPIIFNSIIRDNEAGFLGDNIYCTSNAEFLVSHSNVNTDSIEGNWRGINNIYVDPEFNDDSCHLYWPSFCVNAGIDSLEYLGLWYNCPADDIDGDVRPFDNTFPDIGVDETPNHFVKIPGNNGVSNVTLQAFPNPFFNTTTLKYELRSPAVIQLTIYNQFGKQIEIIRQIQSAGKQQVVWNAERLPSGVYYCVLRTENSMQTIKMIKLK